jgi:tetratricopeptide (TPR) repeat protein
MPAATYMLIDPRRDHSIRVPRPDRSATSGVPNACTGCHVGRPAEWAAERVRAWYGHDPTGFQTFADAFHADAIDAPGAADALARIARDAAEPAIVRASALARLADRPGDAASTAARAGMEDPHPMVREAALRVAEFVEPATRVRWIAPLLRDSARAVRIRAAWALAPAVSLLSTPADRAAFDSAAREYVASRTLDGGRAESHADLADFRMRLGDAGRAVEGYRTALRMNPRLAAASVNLADALRMLGREAEAETTLRAALAVDPGDARLHHALGLSLARLGRHEDATSELARAAALAPDDPDFAYAWAVALHSTGQRPRAVTLLERVIAAHPDHGEALFAIASFERDAGNRSSALAYARRLAAAHPDDPRGPALVASLEN